MKSGPPHSIKLNYSSTCTHHIVLDYFFAGFSKITTGISSASAKKYANIYRKIYRYPLQSTTPPSSKVPHHPLQSTKIYILYQYTVSCFSPYSRVLIRQDSKTNDMSYLILQSTIPNHPRQSTTLFKVSHNPR